MKASWALNISFGALATSADMKLRNMILCSFGDESSSNQIWAFCREERVQALALVQDKSFLSAVSFYYCFKHARTGRGRVWHEAGEKTGVRCFNLWPPKPEMRGSLENEELGSSLVQSLNPQRLTTLQCHLHERHKLRAWGRR